MVSRFDLERQNHHGRGILLKDGKTRRQGPSVPFQEIPEITPGHLFEIQWAGRCSPRTPAVKSCDPVSLLLWTTPPSGTVYA